MNLKEQALEKMLIEMNEKHSDVEDTIHNFLCNQKDDELFEGILKEGKTIAESVQYCISNAKKLATKGCAMVSDDKVFGWVMDYFKKDKIDFEKVNTPTEIKQSQPKRETPKKQPKKAAKPKSVNETQLSLFG